MNRKTVSIVGVLLVFVLATCITPVASAPQEEMLVEGVLTALDIDSNTLSVKTASEQEMQLKCTDETSVVGQDQGLDSLKDKVGTRVKIAYRVVDETPQAIRVEVLQ